MKTLWLAFLLFHSLGAALCSEEVKFSEHLGLHINQDVFLADEGWGKVLELSQSRYGSDALVRFANETKTIRADKLIFEVEDSDHLVGEEVYIEERGRGLGKIHAVYIGGYVGIEFPDGKRKIYHLNHVPRRSVSYGHFHVGFSQDLYTFVQYVLTQAPDVLQIPIEAALAYIKSWRPSQVFSRSNGAGPVRKIFGNWSFSRAFLLVDFKNGQEYVSAEGLYYGVPSYRGVREGSEILTYKMTISHTNGEHTDELIPIEAVVDEVFVGGAGWSPAYFSVHALSQTNETELFASYDRSAFRVSAFVDSTHQRISESENLLIKPEDMVAKVEKVYSGSRLRGLRVQTIDGETELLLDGQHRFYKEDAVYQSIRKGDIVRHYDSGKTGTVEGIFSGHVAVRVEGKIKVFKGNEVGKMSIS